ncbi:MAG: penicillin-binding protein 2 [Rhodospirillaceae bacterium]|nr:penicillin-binding protein 2 [Rhodospirillaceae bacterium]
MPSASQPPCGPAVRIKGRAAEALGLGRMRLRVTAAVFVAAFAAVAGRLVDVTLFHAAGEPAAAALAAPVMETVSRGEIVDRNGMLLATSLPTASLFADAPLVPDVEEAVLRLNSVLPEADPQAVRAALETGRRFVWLHRGLTPAEHHDVNALGIPGFGFEDEERRYYPAGALTAHVVGFTDIDGHGLAGIERRFEDQLVAGESVALSLDMRAQAVVRDAVQAAVDEFSAIGGIGVVTRVRTGEVLAMVSLPDFDPYTAGEAPEDSRFNRAVLGVYEMGSTFKVFNTAMTLDYGVAGLTDGYDATHPLRFGRFTISDYHGRGRWLTVSEIFMYSSNIGSARMARAVGTERQREFLERLGLTRGSPIELPEVGWPMVPDPWREINTMTISFGHGLAVSPMQLVSAMGAVVGDGIYRAPTLLDRADEGSVPGVRVMSEETSRQMRWLMRLVVEEGTGRRADAPGYMVGGKTGTAEKAVGRGYDGNALLSSFIAAFPIDRPEYVVLVMLDEPQLPRSEGRPTGGRVAAPVVREIVERLGPLFGIRPIQGPLPDIREAGLDGAPGAVGQLASFRTAQ